MPRTLRSRPFAHLAVLAMLLLSLLPTAGRLYRASSNAESGALQAALASPNGFGAICSSRGLAYDAALAAREAALFDSLDSIAVADDGTAGDRRDDGTPSPHADDDCDYCALTASTALATSFAFLPHSRPADALVPHIGHDDATSYLGHGLGARGPPTA
ncbi:MAG: DUF2946 family protein [Xanthomonadaceae bacterium]|nr:DUF2946 family protein [Xanthomonadaceae bacterium]